MKIIFYLLMIFSASFLQAQTFSGGSGTESDPYQISTASDLIELSSLELTDIPDYWNKHYILINDIDFGADSSLIDWNNDGVIDWNTSDSLGFSPIGDNPSPGNSSDPQMGDRQQISFSGSFNGKGYIISNLYINRPDESYLGLFGVIRFATIDSIGINNAKITGEVFVAPLVGFSDYGDVLNSFVTNSIIKGGYRVGGLIGHAYGTFDLDNCYITNSNILCGGMCGGMVGYLETSNLYKCYSNAKLDTLDGYTGYYIGGLVGMNWLSDVTYSYWDTTVSKTTFSDGGTPLNPTAFQYKNNFTSWDFDNTWHIGYTNDDNTPLPRLRWQNFTPLYNIIYYNEGKIAFIDSIGPYEKNDDVAVEYKKNLEKDNFKLKSWNTKEDFSGESLFPFTFFNITQDVDVFAQWSINDNTALSTANFSIKSYSPTCFNNNDGRIVIKSELLDMTVLVEGDENVYSLIARDSVVIENLESNTYNLSIHADNDTRNFIIEVPPLEKVKSSMDVQGNSISLSIEGGEAPYKVLFENDVFVTETGRVTINHLKSGNYTLIVQDNNSCTENEILDFSIEQMQTYPNPINEGVLYISLPNSLLEEKCTFNIITLDGSIAISQDRIVDRVNKIDVSSLMEGIYLLKVTCNEYINTIQIIIN